jgi:hypothetical protein
VVEISLRVMYCSDEAFLSLGQMPSLLKFLVGGLFWLPVLSISLGALGCAGELAQWRQCCECQHLRPRFVPKRVSALNLWC